MAERAWAAADFDYRLPDELIAQTPTTERGASRLLVIEREAGCHDVSAWTDDSIGAYGHTPLPPHDQMPIRDARFADIISLIPPGDLLVVNSTRVRHARLLGTTPGGAAAEVLLIHPSTDDSWIAMGKPGRAMQPGKMILLGDGISVETLEVLIDGMRRVHFLGGSAEEAITRFGRLPLPPYIVRDPTADDEQRYQTVYAEREGSVAAPTAGLHFTGELLQSLRSKGVAVAELDLEVGPGTFRPLEDGALSAHLMHAERFEISDRLVDAVTACRSRGGHLWAVGTTVVRALESAVGADGALRAGQQETRLMITPGFHFRMVDHLITNFHLPRSTLLTLVAAFAGHDLTMAAYHHAVAARYRFYSYGDAMCIL